MPEHAELSHAALGYNGGPAAIQRPAFITPDQHGVKQRSPAGAFPSGFGMYVRRDGSARYAPR
jgi:hypothetical protein